jgi:hypothetical protein
MLYAALKRRSSTVLVWFRGVLSEKQILPVSLRARVGMTRFYFPDVSLFCLPVVASAKARDVGYVMAAVPGIERKTFFQADQSEFGMAEGALPVLWL